MSAARMFGKTICGRISSQVCSCPRGLSTAQSLHAGQKWRISQGQAPDGIGYGPLTDLPDWSYADGQPAPQTARRQTRLQRRLNVAERINRLLSEVDEAKNKTSDETNPEDDESEQQNK